MPGVFENRRVADVRASATVHNRYSCAPRVVRIILRDQLRTLSFGRHPFARIGDLKVEYPVSVRHAGDVSVETFNDV